MRWLKSYVENDQFEEDLHLLGRLVKVATIAIIALALYVFGPAFVRMVGELVG